MSKIFRIFLILVLVCSVGYIIWHTYNVKKADDLYDSIKVEVKDEVEKVNIPEIIEETIEKIEKEKVDIPIDFEKLWGINEEIYAWIVIPGTKVDYPILQRPEDDNYYLNHTVDGVSGLPGSIYTESVHGQEFTEPNTVIYGHNMKDDSMFGSLHDFEKADFFKENREIIIYTPTNILNYKIFAAVTYSDEYIPFSYDFLTKEGYQVFLDSVYESKYMTNQYAEDVNVTTSDRIITLSTCVANQPNNRYLVLAVLVDVQ